MTAHIDVATRVESFDSPQSFPQHRLGNAIGLVLRISMVGVAVLLLLAGLGKIAHVMRMLVVSSDRWSDMPWLALAVLELAFVTALLVGRRRRLVYGTGVVMFLAFAMWNVWMLSRGKWLCDCFGVLSSPTSVMLAVDVFCAVVLGACWLRSFGGGDRYGGALLQRSVVRPVWLGVLMPAVAVFSVGFLFPKGADTLATAMGEPLVVDRSPLFELSLDPVVGMDQTISVPIRHRSSRPVRVVGYEMIGGG